MFSLQTRRFCSIKSGKQRELIFWSLRFFWALSLCSPWSENGCFLALECEFFSQMPHVFQPSSSSIVRVWQLSGDRVGKHWNTMVCWYEHSQPERRGCGRRVDDGEVEVKRVSERKKQVHCFSAWQSVYEHWSIHQKDWCSCCHRGNVIYEASTCLSICLCVSSLFPLLPDPSPSPISSLFPDIPPTPCMFLHHFFLLFLWVCTLFYFSLVLFHS